MSNQMTEKEGFFPGVDSLEIYYKLWIPSSNPTARILAIHGLGEHINRYQPMFTAFAEAGILVRGLDYRGHGRTYKNHIQDIKKTKAVQGHVLLEQVFEDILLLSKHDLLQDEQDLPTFVFGHSLGGLIALAFTHLFHNLPNFKGVIAQAPALRPVVPIPAYAKVALRLTSFSMVSRYTDDNKLELDGLTTDQSVIDAYKQDPLVHERISLGLLDGIVTNSKMLFDQADKFIWPVIICHSKQDKFTDCEASQEFVGKIASADKVFKYFEGVGHELHNEMKIKDELTKLYVEWINVRKG